VAACRGGMEVIGREPKALGRREFGVDRVPRPGLATGHWGHRRTGRSGTGASPPAGGHGDDEVMVSPMEEEWFDDREGTIRLPQSNSVIPSQTRRNTGPVRLTRNRLYFSPTTIK